MKRAVPDGTVLFFFLLRIFLSQGFLRDLTT
jgi:hypothetical protein